MGKPRIPRMNTDQKHKSDPCPPCDPWLPLRRVESTGGSARPRIYTDQHGSRTKGSASSATSVASLRRHEPGADGEATDSSDEHGSETQIRSVSSVRSVASSATRGVHRRIGEATDLHGSTRIKNKGIRVLRDIRGFPPPTRARSGWGSHGFLG